MAYVHDVVISKRDAEALARLAAAGGEGLADVMLEARFIADDEAPVDGVGLHSRVTYAEEHGAASRTVVLVAPEDADAALGRVSVLSPVGLALIGRRRGALTEAALPNGRRLSLRVLEVARPRPAAARRGRAADTSPAW